MINLQSLLDFSHTKYKCIKGSAGTGKTHTISNIIKDCPERCVVVSFTNKAVSVLRDKGVPAFTIHKAFYMPIDTGEIRTVMQPVIDAETHLPIKDKNGNILYNEVTEPIYKYEFSESKLRDVCKSLAVPLSHAIVIVDEASMVPAEIWAKLLTEFSGNLILVGDDKQLPPVDNEELQELKSQINNHNLSSEERQNAAYLKNELYPQDGFFLKLTPDITLTKNHRQGLNNAILDVANTIIQTGNWPCPFVADNVICTNWIKSGVSIESDMARSIFANADVVIAHKNSTCRTINSLIRSERYASEFAKLTELKQRMPRLGDKLYVTKTLKLTRDTQITKGEILTIASEPIFDLVQNIALVDLGEIDSGGQTKSYYENVTLRLDFVTGAKSSKALPGLWAEYGYCITCHKSQGSQWQSVVVIDEGVWHSRKEWLYTAVTRASHMLVVIGYMTQRAHLGVGK